MPQAVFKNVFALQLELDGKGQEERKQSANSAAPWQFSYTADQPVTLVLLKREQDV